MRGLYHSSYEPGLGFIWRESDGLLAWIEGAQAVVEDVAPQHGRNPVAGVNLLFGGHGESPVNYQDSIMIVGNDFLDQQYPGLDTIVGTRAGGSGE